MRAPFDGSKDAIAAARTNANLTAFINAGVSGAEPAPAEMNAVLGWAGAQTHIFDPFWQAGGAFDEDLR